MTTTDIIAISAFFISLAALVNSLRREKQSKALLLAEKRREAINKLMSMFLYIGEQSKQIRKRVKRTDPGRERDALENIIAKSEKIQGALSKHLLMVSKEQSATPDTFENYMAFIELLEKQAASNYKSVHDTDGG